MAKTYIDASDQKKTYSDPCRKGVKWYRKVIIELLCNTSMVNAYILYLGIMQEQISITEFREHIVNSLTFNSQRPAQNVPIPQTEQNLIRVRHQLLQKESRGRCVTCYRRVCDSKDIPTAQKLSFIHFYCPKCPEKFMCLECFGRRHAITLR